MRESASRCATLAVAVACLAITGCGASRSGSPGLEDPTAFVREDSFTKRPFQTVSGGRWIGNGVAYGPHRDGQRPGGTSPSQEELREDLGLLSKHWNLLRTYDAVGPAETLLEVIQKDNFDMRVMLGVWIAIEERRDSTGAVIEEYPAAREANRQEVETAIRLASAFPEIVLALCVGNETQVFWSAHRSPRDILISHVREVRGRVQLPVTVADDFNFWNKPESQAVAAELDFIVMHAHPLWNGLQLEDALEWSRGKVAEIQAAHPGRVVVLGETGWATQKHTEGEQAELMKGKPGEEEQKVFFEEVTAWSKEDRMPVFFFEAFDENWKGGEHPDEVEKHWGLFRADRTPKAALAGRVDP